jgi:transcriptional regulator with XRE-family HTH domain
MQPFFKLGSDLRDARRRRRISTVVMSERAGLTRQTLHRLEKGDPSVSIGKLAAVLEALGLEERLRDLADLAHDPLGQELEAEKLPQRIRFSRTGSLGPGRKIKPPRSVNE